MARPQKQTVDYFPHYANRKKTIFILEQRYGNDGYAFWFKLLESLAETDGHYLDLSDETAWEFLQAKTRQSDSFCTEILSLLVKLGAVDRELWRDYKVIWCQNFVDGIADVYKNRRASTPVRPSFYSQELPLASVSTDGNPQSKVKETKLKYMVIAKYPNIKLTQGEYDKLFAKFDYKGTMDRIENLSLYIGSKGDHYKSHYFTILSWDRRDARDKPKRPRGEDKW